MIDRKKLPSVKYGVGFLIMMFFFFFDYASAGGPSGIMDEASIQAMIERAEPLVEEITGREYKNRITFKLVKRGVVRDVLTEELRPQLKNLLKSASDDLISRQAETAAHMMSQFLLGKYSYLKNVFYIIPDNVKSQVEILEIRDEFFEDFVFLVVAHEMIHVLDDQYFNLFKKMTTTASAEKMQALNALIEGHAVYVAKKISDRLGCSETSHKLSVKSAAGIMDESNRMQQQIYHSIYVNGSEFIKAIIEKEGPAVVAKAFASPPESTREIMHPEEYLNPLSHCSLDCEKLLEKVADELPTDGMRIQTITVGPMTLSAILVSLGISEREANALAADCLNGAIITAAKPALKPNMVAAYVLNFINKEAADKLMELVKKLNKSDEDQFNAKLNATYNLVREEELELNGFDYAVYRHVEKKLDGDVTREIRADGTIDTVYVALEFMNVKKEIAIQDITGILNSIYSEQLKLKKKPEPAARSKGGYNGSTGVTTV